MLSDEVRHTFALSGQLEPGTSENPTRIAMSTEGLRTTTRMMYAVAWLLNHRAFFRGEISDFQLRRHGRLSPDTRLSDPGQLAILPRDVQELIQATLRFYDRLLRLDRSWRQAEEDGQRAIVTLRDRLERRLAS